MARHVDHGQLPGIRDDEAVALLRAGRDTWLDRELDLARLLWRLDVDAAFVFEGAACVEELASRAGYDGFRCRQLLDLGYALAGEPLLDEALRKNEVGMPAAIAIGAIHRGPDLLFDGDDWLQLARFTPLRTLERRVRARREEVRQQVKRVRRWGAYIGDQTREDLERCRVVATRMAKQTLTNGQLLAVLAASYRDLRDPTAKEPRARRVPPTVERLFDRYVPAEVRRRILERSEGRCEFGACGRVGFELCHLTPHRDGSSREVRDLVIGCRLHHREHDNGLIRLVGWSPDGRAVFMVDPTNEVLTPKPWPEPEAPAERPDWLLRALGKRHSARRKARTRRPAPDGRARPPVGRSRVVGPPVVEPPRPLGLPPPPRRLALPAGPLGLAKVVFPTRRHPPGPPSSHRPRDPHRRRE